MRPLILTDLDDTLWSTARKIDGIDLADCTIASTLVDGRPSGYRTPRQQQLWRLMSLGDVVPVTARGRDVMARCDVPQAPAICSNGGVVVDAEGRIDGGWHARIAEKVGDGGTMRELHHRLADLAGPGFRHWTVDEAATPLYIVFKSDASDEEAVAGLGRAAVDVMPDAEWRIHVNGNNMAVMPPWISKRAAARHVIAQARSRQPERLVVGVGDSVSDLGFMAECDFAVHPAASQIARHLADTHPW